jgi:anti-anti-sigma factor
MLMERHIMSHVSSSLRDWDFDVERGPDWLYVRPHRGVDDSRSSRRFADQIWSLLEQNFTCRVVLEMGEVDQLDSGLITQLIELHRRIQSHGGMMRISNLSANNVDLLHRCGLNGYLPCFRDREAAVMAYGRPNQPR